MSCGPIDHGGGHFSYGKQSLCFEKTGSGILPQNINQPAGITENIVMFRRAGRAHNVT